MTFQSELSLCDWCHKLTLYQLQTGYSLGTVRELQLRSDSCSLCRLVLQKLALPVIGGMEAIVVRLRDVSDSKELVTKYTPPGPTSSYNFPLTFIASEALISGSWNRLALYRLFATEGTTLLCPFQATID